MAWIAEYRTEFTDILGQDWKVEIESVDFAGDVTTMQAEVPTLNIQFLATSDDFFDGPIKGSIAELTIRADTNFQYAALCSFADMQYRMSIYYSTTLYWRGYVTSENYSEPYDTIPYQVTITATDGLGMLKEYIYKYQTVDPDDTYYDGRRLESQIIIDILSKIGIPAVALDPIFTEYVNIYEESMADGAGDSPMDQLMIDVDVFKDMYCYDVLCEILKKYNACIRTYLGAYIIYRPVELSQAIVYGRIFTAATTKTPTSIIPLQYISRTTHPTDLDDYNGGTLMIQKPAKKVTIIQDYGNKDSWIENWKFEGNRLSGSYMTGFIAEGWTNVTDAQPLIIPINRIVPSETDGIVLEQLNASMENYIWQGFGTYGIIGDEFLCFEFEYRWFNYSGANHTAQTFNFTVSAVDTNYSLQGIAGDEIYGEWVTPAAHMSITENVANGDSGWKTFKRIFNTGFDVAGPYKAYFYCLDDAYTITMGIRNVRFYATSDEITIKKRKHKGPFPRLARWILNVKEYIKEYIDVPEVVERDYVKTNLINGNELRGDCLLGDVIDTNIDNVIEQFKGSLSTAITTLFYRQDKVTLDSGSSGTADIHCSGRTKTATWDTSLAHTAEEFADDFAADYLSDTPSIIVTHSGADIIFTAAVAGVDFTDETSITANEMPPELDGHVTEIQTELSSTVTDYTTEWNTRNPGDESKELLSIMVDELAKQYSRPKQFLSLPIREGNTDGNDPHVDLLGNFKDDLNIDGSNFNIRVIAGWTKSNCTLTLSGNYTRYTSTSTDSNINKDGFSIVGSTDKTICIRYKIISGTPGYGQIFYTTTGHGRSSSYYKLFTTLTDGEWHLLYLDMSDLTAGGTDWIDNIITKIWIDLVENNTVVVDLDYIGFDRIFVFNKGQFNVRDREWNIDLIEII